MNDKTATAINAVKYSAEQAARALLDRMGVPNAHAYSSGDLVELANLIADSAQRVPVAYLDLDKLAVGGMAYATSFRTSPAQTALAAMTTGTAATAQQAAQPVTLPEPTLKDSPYYHTDDDQARAWLNGYNDARNALGEQKPVARLQEEISDRPFNKGQTYFEVVILDRERCKDGMELFAAAAPDMGSDCPTYEPTAQEPTKEGEAP